MKDKQEIKEMLRKAIDVSAEAGSAAKEKIEKAFHNMTQKGKFTPEEAKKIGAKWAEESKKEMIRTKSDVISAFSDLKERVDFVNRRDFDALVKRVEALEKVLEHSQKGCSSHSDKQEKHCCQHKKVPESDLGVH